MARDSNVISLSGHHSSARFSMPDELVRLRDKSGQALRQVLYRFFEQADDRLFELADRAGSNQDQTAYFDAMRELRLRRKSMTVSVLQFVSQSFNDLGRTQPRRSSGSLEDVEHDALSLVEDEVLEQQVAVDNLSTRLRDRHRDSVRLLVARMHHLAPELTLSEDTMPLSPCVIGAAIGEACADLDVDIRSKLVILKLFEQSLSEKLGEFYKSCNQLLISEGILPEMTRPPVGRSESVRKHHRSETSIDNDEDGRNVSDTDDAEALSADDAQTFGELTRLLRQGRQDTGITPTGATGRVLPRRQLMGQLDLLQERTQSVPADDMLTLREQLSPLMTAVQNADASVTQSDSDVINLVAMLFDFILEDRQLHPVMKALISRLQIPVLKVALDDRNFFNRGGHPARKLLNELALAAIGWNDRGGDARDPLREKIEEIVSRVLNEFGEGTDLFEVLLDDFSHFTDLDRRRRELVEQRLKDAEEGRAKNENAARLAIQTIQRERGDKEITDTLQEMLNEPWARFLQWTILRNGEDSEAWRRACDITSRLLWSLDPEPVTGQTRSDLLRLIPHVVNDVRSGLQEISWDPFATDSAIRDLELAHLNVLQRLVTAPVEEVPDTQASQIEKPDVPNAPVSPGAPPAEQSSVEAAASSVSESTTQPEKLVGESVPADSAQPPAEWLEKADQLRVGSWVEMAGDSSRFRCKLAAFIRATGKYIFVNRSGAKVAEYYRDSLALAMQEQLIVVLDDGLIFDRALESVIDNLRHNRKD